MAERVKNLVMVDDLLIDLMTALGHGHRRLLDASVSDVGGLAVKSAEVVVEFDMSAEQRKTASGVSLGVRPAPLFTPPSVGVDNTSSESTLTASNRARMTIQIVNIPTVADEPDPKPKKKKKKKPSADPDDPVVKKAADPGRPITPDRPTDPDPQKKAAAALQALRDAIERRGVLADRPQVRRRLDDAIARYHAAPSAETRGAVLELIRPEWRRADFVPSFEVLHELEAAGLLDALADDDRRFRDALAPGLRQLVAMVDTFELGADAVLAFHKAVDEVLGSASQTEARGRLVAAVRRLRRQTADQPLPEGMHQFLAGLELGE